MSPKDNNKQVSAAVRILQQKRDASARATHLMVKNDPLITYEKAFLNQAAVKKFFIATFLERKIMSTKTSIKRIALVAAAALALGGFSAVSAKAAQTVAQTYVNCTTADGGTITPASDAGKECQGVAGEGNYVVLTTLSQAKDVKLNVSGAGASFSSPGGSGFAALAAPNTTAFWTASTAGTIRVLTPTVGTITVTVAASTSGSGIYTATTETVVITVVDKAAAGVYSATNSKVYLVAGETMTATADATTPPTAVATYSQNDSSVASIVVKYLDGLGTGSAVQNDTLTATITSGPGYILVPRLASDVHNTGYASDTTTANYNGASATGTYKAGAAVGLVSGSAQVRAGGNFTALVFASGQTGTTVVTIKNTAGTIIGTKSVVFTGTTPATYTATVVKAFVDGDTAYTTGVHGDSRNAAIKLVAADSAGNPIPGAAAPTITSTSTILSAGTGNDGIDTATADSKGVFYFFAKSSTAATYGPATVTFTSPDTLVKATATLTWSSKKASTFTITGPASAGTGDALTFTATAKDGKGYAIPDGLVASTYIAASPVTSAGIGTPALTGKFANGVATLAATGATVSAASAVVTFTLTGTAATADTQYVSTLAGTEIPVTLTLESPTDATASLALDAANAATDAANNAYDEAQNATQAASDALAAVTALAKQVKSLIASVKRLTAAVAKLK